MLHADRSSLPGTNLGLRAEQVRDQPVWALALGDTGASVACWVRMGPGGFSTQPHGGGSACPNHPGAVRSEHADRSQTPTGGGSTSGLALAVTVSDCEVVTFHPDG
jgi:hypothetical protein